MPPFAKRWLCFLFVLGFWLRLPGLFANTFHADEALFSSWAQLIWARHDPWLLTQVVDKPPLLFYLQTAVFPLFGPTMWAARLPNWVASLLLPLLVGRKLWRWFGEGETAVIATIFLTLAPLTIQFSPTAFTDPLLVFFLWLSLPAARRRQMRTNGGKSAVWCGFFFGCALLTKHQAWLFFPLLVAMGWLLGWRRQAWGGWLVGWLPLALLLVGWELGRNGRFLLWQQQLDNFGGLRLIWSWELWPRLWAWGVLGKTAVGGLFVGVLLLGCLLWLLWHTPQPLDAVFSLFVVGYLAFHWLLAIPVWDRYWLPLLPLLAVLLGRAMGRGRTQANAGGAASRWCFPYMLSLGLLLFMLPTAVRAQNGRFPLGGSPQADDGAAVVAHYLAAQPYGTVLYDHWYSWQWRYHLFNQRVYVSWFPYPAALEADLQAFGSNEAVRYVVLPPGDSGQPVRRAVESAGFWLRPVPLPTRMTLYEVKKRPEIQ